MYRVTMRPSTYTGRNANLARPSVRSTRLSVSNALLENKQKPSCRHGMPIVLALPAPRRSLHPICYLLILYRDRNVKIDF